MATATKSSRQLISNGSISSSNSSSGSQDISTALGGTLTALIGIGSSNDGTASTVVVEVSDDGATWREFSKVESGTSTSTDYEFVFEIPASVMHLKTTINNNDSNNSITGEATLQELTSIG